MMKGGSILVLLMLASGNDARQEHKCWLRDEAGHQRIVHYQLRPARLEQQMTGLAGRLLVQSGNRIAQVMECVPYKGKFRSRQARALEQLTPR
ncbi:TapY2 family type IVa secretion system protein [Ferrimonas sp. SCSIO 43195]|nr:TapY2 family type IVa secretion system protein [Ferrimonas sp. SCSIO 43195]